MSVTMRRVEIGKLGSAGLAAIVSRSPVPDPAVRQKAAGIVAEVRAGGDAALEAANRTHGGSLRGTRMRVDPAQCDSALDALDPAVRAALEAAAANIKACHVAQRPHDSSLEVQPGVHVRRTWSPLQRVGVYVPGGRAAYPSSLLMGVIPATVAGVGEIVVVSPAGEDGDISGVLLAAAAMVGVDELYATGGAQAIAALAYGTETIRPVDKIVGPGNAWVTAAKLAVFGDVAIDLPAGPSEALVIADDAANPRVVAADLLCQAEHGPDSPSILVTTSQASADAVVAAMNDLLPRLERRSIVLSSLDKVGLVAVAKDIDEAIEFTNAYAPEHAGVQTTDAAEVASRLTTSGSVFVGHWAPHSAGDYATGANHVLPTGGLARSFGPLSVENFGSWRQTQELSRDGLAALSETITTLASAEGLTAHRLAAEVRFEEPAP